MTPAKPRQRGSEMRSDMPCGRCDVGIYDAAAACNPLAQSILDGGPIPRCKLAKRPCVGALDLAGQHEGAKK